MLEMLRNGAKTWVAKGFFILLVGSFAIWGVSRSMVTGSSDSVVTVGDQKIDTREFRMAYERQVSILSRQFGAQLTSEQARAFGVDQQVISQLVAGAALDQLSESMNLGLSKGRLAQIISEEPAFRAVNGQFDRNLFQNRLHNAGLTEGDYIDSQSKAAVRSQIVDAVADGFTAPDTLIKALTQFANETRSVDYLLLSFANIEPVKAPEADVLAAWFEKNKARYRAPEYRTFSYVKLEPSDIVDPTLVTDDAVKEDYEKRKDTYRTPEKRTIEQLTFASKADADAAVAKLASGTTFDQLVTDAGKTASDVLLGDFTKETLPDTKIADAAFAVKANGETSAVLEGSFGPVILRISNIVPETTKSFDEVKDSIRKDLALGLANEEVLNVHDKFEDARASGATLAESAAQLKLKAVTVDATDTAGLDKAGVEIKGLPQAAELLSAVFKSEVGVETNPVNIGNDGYIWFDVSDIIAERDRTLDEVKDKVVTDWTLEQQKTALAAKAAEMVTAIKGGKKLADFASDMGLVVETKSGIKRSTDDPVLSKVAIAQAFDGPLGYVANAEGVDGDGQIILAVTEVNTQATTDVMDDQTQQITTLAKAAGDDILDQMVDQLKNQYGVSMNRDLANSAMVR
jgi:peptidyl-prolyl cis-trans isomerase D